MGAGRGLAVYGLIFAAALLPLMVTPIVPSIDFYNHIARFYVLAHVGDGGFLAQHYEASWRLLPNIGLDVIATALARSIPPLAVAKLVTVLIFAVQYSGLLFLSRRLTGRVHWLTAVLAVPLLYSFIFNWGFANFLFGLGLAFWAAGWWLMMRSRLLVALPVAILLAVAIFFAHAFAFAIYGLLVFCLEAGLWLSGRGALKDAIKTACALAAQAVIPVLLFLASATSKSQVGMTNADESIETLHTNGRLAARIAEEIAHRTETVVRVGESPSYAFDAVAFVLTLAILAALFLRGRLTIARIAWPALAAFAAMAVVIPPNMFGVGFVSDRIPLVVAMLAVAAMKPSLEPGADRAWAGALVALTVVRIAYIGWDWHGYSADFRAFERIAAQIPPHQLAEGVTLGKIGGRKPDARCEMYGPLLTALHGQASPLFANETQQPLRLKGELADAVAGRSGDPGGGFAYVLTCDPRPSAAKASPDGRFRLKSMHGQPRAKTPG